MFFNLRLQKQLICYICPIRGTLPCSGIENNLGEFSADHVVITFTDVNEGTFRTFLLSPMW